MRAQQIPPVGLQEAQLSDFQVLTVTFDARARVGGTRHHLTTKGINAIAFSSLTIFGTLAAIAWGLLVVVAAFK